MTSLLYPNPSKISIYQKSMMLNFLKTSKTESWIG